VKARIVAALSLEVLTAKQLQAATGATEGTIRNKLSELRREEIVTDDGRRPATYFLVSSLPPNTRVSDDDDTSEPTVAGFFAKPPSWLPAQLAKYREDPRRHLQPLCNSIAAVVLEDPTRGPEVREEVERELARWIV
jgi:DNA-binding transcriptional ArsR family regulator